MIYCRYDLFIRVAGPFSILDYYYYICNVYVCMCCIQYSIANQSVTTHLTQLEIDVVTLRLPWSILLRIVFVFSEYKTN